MIMASPSEQKDARDILQGKNLMPLVRNETSTINRDTILIEHLWDFSEIPPSEGVRTKNWKYFRYVNDKTIEELYDLKRDPKEVNNLIGKKKHKVVADKLRTQLDKLIAKNSNEYRSAPTDLTLELIREPNTNVEIIDLNPEFGWAVPLGSKFQSAYQILVASSQAIIDTNNGDAWDSKKIRSLASTNVEYNGTPLEVDRTYYWKVRIWDEENRLVDYSEVQKFTTGKQKIQKRPRVTAPTQPQNLSNKVKGFIEGLTRAPFNPSRL